MVHLTSDYRNCCVLRAHTGGQGGGDPGGLTGCRVESCRLASSYTLTAQRSIPPQPQFKLEIGLELQKLNQP